MSERLPTVYHGLPSPDGEADTAIVNDAVQDIVTRLNMVPEHLALRVICSVMVSVVCAQTDPYGTFQLIGANVAQAVNDALVEPEGRA